MQLVISLNEERRNKEDEDIADLAWLTDRDLVQIGKNLCFLDRDLTWIKTTMV